jgi:NitT/TauT family transport system permease protein
MRWGGIRIIAQIHFGALLVPIGSAQPYIIGLYSIPKIALAPVFIVWLGLGIASKVAVVFLASFFLVFFNTYAGLLAVNEELVRLARLMGASWPQAIWRVVLPAAAPQIFLTSNRSPPTR